MILKIFSMSLDWYSQFNYLLLKVVTLLILSVDHKSLKYVLLVSPYRITNLFKILLESCEKSVVKLRNWKNDNLVVFDEDCFYHTWSVVGSPLIDSFLETLQTIGDKYAPGMERVVSKHDCPFYDNEPRACKSKRRQLERLCRKSRSTINKLHLQIATGIYFKLFHKKRSRFLEKNFNGADTSKQKFAANKTLLGSEKKQTLHGVFPRVKIANKFNGFFYQKFRIFLKPFRQF